MAHGHDSHHHGDFVEKFTISAGLRKFIFGIIGIGAFFLILGVVINIAMGDPRLNVEEPADDHGGHGSGGHGSVYTPNPNSVPATLVANNSGDLLAQADEFHGEAAPADSAAATDTAAMPAEANAHEAAAAPAAGGHGDAHGGGHGGGYDMGDALGRNIDTGHAHGPEWTGPYWLNRLMSSFVQYGFFFLGISIIMIFFIAVKFTANAGWHVLMMRIPLAFAEFMPIGWILLMIVVLLEFAGVVHIHPWTDSERVAGDPLLQAKTWYLSPVFFFIRQILAGVGWYMAIVAFRKLGEKQAQLASVKTFWTQRKVAAGFLVFFAFTFCAMAFDWMMAMDPHWFSTMFGVHMFASCWVSALAFIAIIMTYMKRAGFMPQLNEAHFHDIGKLVFGFSVFWTYIYFCQFLLIWYANIPEETMYYKRILDNYPFLFALNFVINFIFPLLALMTNTSKRQPMTLSFACVVIILGHFVDMYVSTGPSVYGEFGGIGLTEIGTFLLLLGTFLYLGFNSLTKRSLVAKNHPYLEESVHHYY